MKDAQTFKEVFQLVDSSKTIESMTKAFFALLTICWKNNVHLNKIRKEQKNASRSLSRVRRTIRENQLENSKKREELLRNDINNLQNQVSEISEYCGAYDWMISEASEDSKMVSTDNEVI